MNLKSTVSLRAVPPIDCGGSELSHGGSSSSSSGYWSGWHGTGSPATPPDDGLDAEPALVPLNEPAAHKRKVSGTDGRMDACCVV